MLTVCPTPIGNLGDVTERVLEALRTADVIIESDQEQVVRLAQRLEHQLRASARA